jgi:hypothetical protein
MNLLNFTEQYQDVMKRKNIVHNLILIITLAIPCSLSSQEMGTFQKLEVGINGPAMSLEVPLSNRITVEPAIGLGPTYDLHSEEYGLAARIDWHWAILEPSFHASVYGKFFYDRNKRIVNRKSLSLNSGHFIGVKLKYISKSLSSPQYFSNTILANLNWGGQHNIGKHWLYSYSVGLGYGHNMDNSYGLFYPAFDLKIVYVLPFFSKVKQNR